MKFTVSFKDPDALDASLLDYPEHSQKVSKAFANKFLTWGEYVDIEFDTEKGTATVLRVHD
jgi:hypothetical protein